MQAARPRSCWLQEGLWSRSGPCGCTRLNTVLHGHLQAAEAQPAAFVHRYQQHLKAEVQDLLKEYRIGTVEGYKAGTPAESSMADPWTHEPSRHPALILR